MDKHYYIVITPFGTHQYEADSFALAEQLHKDFTAERIISITVI